MGDGDYWAFANDEYRRKQAREHYLFSLDCIHVIADKLRETSDLSWIEFYEREQAKNREYLIEAAETYKRIFGQYPGGYTHG